ncbi:MAG: MazG family protein [Lachnospiraceae bacterium]|nr:MazG family protein [Lachnospiraceae bacterium]
MKKKYTFEELVKIVEELRSEHGCPWDKEQTHQSLRPCMMEEAAELLAAIRIYEQTNNADNMQEELGDILLQAVMHSVIAGEEGLFTIEDVISGISEKMIRRHPHVFGDKAAENAGQALESWEEIKRQEKKEQTWVTSALREIPAELPSLTRAVKVAKKLDKLPEYHRTNGASVIEDYDTLMGQLQEQAKAFAALGKQASKQEKNEQMTKMLQILCHISYREGLQPEQLLYDEIEKQIDFYEKSV